MLWDYLRAVPVDEGAPPLTRGRPDTWGDASWPGDVNTGIITGYGAGQSELLWHVRQSAAVRRSFARIWGVEDAELITSFDGANIFRCLRPLPSVPPSWLCAAVAGPRAHGRLDRPERTTRKRVRLRGRRRSRDREAQSAPRGGLRSA